MLRQRGAARHPKFKPHSDRIRLERFQIIWNRSRPRLRPAGRPARPLKARTVRSAAVSDKQPRAVPLNAEPL